MPRCYGVCKDVADSGVDKVADSGLNTVGGGAGGASYGVAGCDVVGWASS